MTQIIISIGREFGSGGHLVAQKVAEHYNIPLYSKELLYEIAKKEGKYKLTLSSNHQLTSALRLYESMGFTYTTCDTPHFELSDIYMELLL